MNTSLTGRAEGVQSEAPDGVDKPPPQSIPTGHFAARLRRASPPLRLIFLRRFGAGPSLSSPQSPPPPAVATLPPLASPPATAASPPLASPPPVSPSPVVATPTN